MYIIAAHGTDSTYAARSAAEYTTNEGQTADWFLPSLGELNLLYTNKEEAGITITSPPYETFWSSSEQNQGRAYFQNFSTGSWANNGGITKTYTYYNVRAIRAF